MKITVVICTRNPHLGRLTRVFDGLLAQDLAPDDWELVLVDNASRPPVAPPDWPSSYSIRVVPAPRPGLFHARLTAIAVCHTPFIVFIDDDTVPSPGFLRALRDAFLSDPNLVSAGPRILPEHDLHPPAWLSEFDWALAVRNLGPQPLSWALADGLPVPHFTPIGAGLALRTAALPVYVAHAQTFEKEILARSWIGQGCGGCEDKDLVLTLVRAGGRVAYCPDAVLHHLIPSERIEPAYLEKLLPGLGYLWMRTLHAHGLGYASPISRAGCALRTARAWLVHRAWRRPVPRFRWLASTGLFRGLAANYRDHFRYPSPNR